MVVDRYRPRGLILDLAILVGVPALLLGVYCLPEPTRIELALLYTEPTVLSAYTMHFVHLSADHLVTNLVAYLLVVPLTYVLAVRAGRRDVFRVATVTFLVAFPLVLSGLNLLVERPRIGYGFSGINMAFLGLLPLMLLSYLKRHAPATFELDHAPALFFAGVGLIAALAVPSPRLRLGIAGFAACGATLYLRGLTPIRRLRADVRSLFAEEGAEYAVVGLLVFGLLPIAAFPPDPTGAGSVLNLYTHLLGYCLGFIAPYATVTLLDGARSPSAGDQGRTPIDSSQSALDRFYG